MRGMRFTLHTYMYFQGEGKCRLIFLSITHKLDSDHDAEFDVC